MRIVDIREQTVPVSSPGSNAFIDFGPMTASVVAVVSDAVRDGEPLVGYGFNSNGRYAQGGILRDRILHRLRDAEPDELVGEDGSLDPERAWDVMMRNEKPGGHGERSVAVGIVDMALWDLAAKAAGLPLHALIARRYGDGSHDERVETYAAGGVGRW